MAGFVVLPQHRNPWMEQLPRFVQQLAFQKIGQKFQAQQNAQRQGVYAEQKEQDRAFTVEQEKEARVYAEEQKRLDQSFKMGTNKDLQPIEMENLPAGMPYTYDPVSGKAYVKYRKPDTTTQIKNYNMAIQQHLQGKAPYPGTFSDYSKAQSRAGATRIGLGTKVAEKEALSKVAMQQEVKKPNLRNKSMDFLKKQDPDWDEKDLWVKEEMIFKEMNQQIQVAYDNKAVFDEERNPPGWYVGNKLVRSWKDPIKHRSDKIR